MIPCTACHKGVEENTESLKQEENPEEYKMLAGESADTVEARDEWIDAVERSLEFEAFEDGEKHLDRGLGRVSEEGYYPLREIPKWMI